MSLTAKVSEHQHQVTFFQYVDVLAQRYPILSTNVFAIPNGGNRDLITGTRLKREGVRAGAPDILVAIPIQPWHGLFIEMKVRPNKPSKKQVIFLCNLLSAGYKTHVSYDAEDAIKALDSYLGIRVGGFSNRLTSS
jgi:hypothetical protein